MIIFTKIKSKIGVFMINKTFTSPKNGYFAAANGYGGFRSYFNCIFDPKKFTRIYVLKGGPGTGKSSLMKKISVWAQEKNLETEVVFCSSDPNSLDGVIVGLENRKIAIIDGTAPHETDAKIPGAADEIINLGELWSKKKLTEQREEILRLNSLKSFHYKNAYSYLSLAGEFSKRSFKILVDSYEKCDKDFINKVLLEIPDGRENNKSDVKLFSSFSKDGYEQLDAKNFAGRKNYTVTGILNSEFIFMKNLLNTAKFRHMDFIRFPSPYSDDITEAIYFTAADVFVSIGNNFETIIDTSTFLNENKLKMNSNFLDYSLMRQNELLIKSQEEFSNASDKHFLLEKIYTDTMDFSGTDDIVKKIINEFSEQC